MVSRLAGKLHTVFCFFFAKLITKTFEFKSNPTLLPGEYLENSDSDPIQFLLAGSLEEEPDKRPR